ncbi:MAG: DUF1015 domain-containing protein [Candidatus Hydrogenedentes bacterium]|nr:DUF1015 domain-containing protein [Candidatus Hydrogenedentota bacterium]
MLEIRGFRGFRFDLETVGSLDSVITPPYDVISPEQRQTLAGRSPFSMAHLILPQDEPESGLDRYQAAGRRLEAWITGGVLRQDSRESLYLLRQTFRDERGEERVRRGFLGVARIPEPGERLILGHERTFESTVDDRLRLTRSTRANLGPVFALYADPEGRMGRVLGQADQRPPELTAQTIDGVKQEVWRVDADPFVTEFFKNKRLYVADGHHRYRTACVYRDQMRAARSGDGPHPYDYVMMGFVSLNDPGLIIHPTHRLLAMPEGFDPAEFFKKLDRWFEVEPVDGALERQVEQATKCVIGVAFYGGGEFLLRLRKDARQDLLGGVRSPAWRALDVAVLHAGIVERAIGPGDELTFTYERDGGEAVRLVREGKFGIAFIMKAATADQIRACAEAGESMPHKSTYFFPKLPTGAAIHRLI